MMTMAAYNRLLAAQTRETVHSSTAFALLMDSGATDCIVHDHTLLTNYTTLSEHIKVQVGDGFHLTIQGYGTLTIQMEGGSIELPYTLHVPSLKCNLLSISSLSQLGYTTVFNDKRASVFDSSHNLIMTAKLIDNLYLMDLKHHSHMNISHAERREYAHFINAAAHLHDSSFSKQFSHSTHEVHSNILDRLCRSAAMAIGTLYKSHTVAEINPVFTQTANPDPTTVAQAQAINEAALWHARLGHISKTTLKATAPVVKGLPDYELIEPYYGLPCEHCIAGRFPAGSHPSVQPSETLLPCDTVYCDLTGKYKPSVDGSLYTLNMVDHATGYAYVTCIKNKKEVADALREGINRMQQLSGRSIKHIRTDYGSEFHCPEVMDLLAEKHIMYTHTIPYTPQQNGCVERFNRSCMEICRALMSHCKRNRSLWSDAYVHACWLHNRRVSTHRSTVTRYEAFTGHRPDLSNIKIWGSKCFVRVPVHHSKLTPRGIAAIFIGMDEFSHGYRVRVGTAVYVREDVIFSEQELGHTTDVDLNLTPAMQSTRQELEDYMREQYGEVFTDFPSTQEQVTASPKPKRQRHERQEETVRSPAAHTRSKAAPAPLQHTAYTVSHQCSQQTSQHTAHAPKPMRALQHKLSPAVYTALLHGFVYEPKVFTASTDSILADTAMHEILNWKGVVGDEGVDDDDAQTCTASAHVAHTTAQHTADPTVPPTVTPSVPLAAQKPFYIMPPFPTVVPGKDLPVPSTLEQAQSSAFWPHWHKAINDEFSSMLENQVFQLVELPAGKRALTARWIFTWKTSGETIIRAKARIVARGYEQAHGIDFDHIFSPTVNKDTLRMLFAHAAMHDSYIHAIDIKTAFLHGILEEEIFLFPPPGCSDNTNRVWKLCRALYGLKQAPRAWHKKLKHTLVQLGFTPSDEDMSLFIKDEGGHRMFLAAHVDDMLILHPSKQSVLQVVQEIKKHFDITDLGPVTSYLKVNVHRFDTGHIMLHQKDYTSAVIAKYFNRHDLSTDKQFALTPLPTGFVFRKLQSLFASCEDECIPCDVNIYQQIVGSLMYICNFTRPDICWSVHQCCRYMSAPSLQHYKATQYILAYLNSTLDYGLVFSPDRANSTIIGYCDASHHSCPDTLRSCTGYCYTYGGSLISWQSKMQSTVALSTSESEYMSINSSGREGVYLQRLYEELSLTSIPVPIHVGQILPSFSHDTTSKKVEAIRQAQLIFNDNMSAVHMVNNNASTKLSKHISKTHHWSREKVEEKLLQFTHISGTENMSDALTKSLPAPTFQKHRAAMGIHSLADMEKLIRS